MSDLVFALEAQMRVLGRRVRRVVAERAAAVDPALGEVGYGVMEYLHRLGVCRQRDLVAGLSVEKAAVSRAVSQLVDLGLVGRVDDPDDGRGHMLALTEEGGARITGVLTARRTAYAAKLADWSAEDLAAFVAMLERYNAAIESR
jgi:DNA-binding MarR family transcriptional regulator